MDDLVNSGFGAEATDQAFIAANVRPVWHLVPLPLSQILESPPSSSPTHHPVLPSLHSLCLSSISRHFHLFTPLTLSTLPSSLLSRLLHRVRSDRQYESHHYGNPNPRPDITTIWAYSALLDPQGSHTEMDHVIALHQCSTLFYLATNIHLAEPEHPFVSLPKLYKQLHHHAWGGPPLSFLTTLTLEPVDGAVTDETILNLRWCTHLTLLWMKGCNVTDGGVRLLASSLELPGIEGTTGDGDNEMTGAGRGRGMWRLRAWFLPGCKGVTDRSMRSFARWPGLVVLDVRDTSVTTTGIEIFNRASRTYFTGQNADFQPCTVGLRSIFSTESSPKDILESLCLTLITNPSAPSTPPLSGGSNSDRWWLGLHIVPSLHPKPPLWLPNPTSTSTHSDPLGSKFNYRSTSVYRPGGIGQVYGANVGGISDEARSLRDNLKTSLRIQAEDEGLCERQKPWWEEEKEWRRKYGRSRNEKGRGGWDRGETKVKKPSSYKVKSWEADKSKTFVMGGGGSVGEATSKGKARRKKGELQGEEDEESEEVKEVKGEEKCMMVRMVCEHWETLVWSTSQAIQSTPSTTHGLVFSERSRTLRTNSSLVADILGTRSQCQSRLPTQRQSVKQSQTQVSSATPRNGPFRPRSYPSSSPSSSQLPTPLSTDTSTSLLSSTQTLTQASSSPPTSQPTLNPFKATKPLQPSDVKPLSLLSSKSEMDGDGDGDGGLAFDSFDSFISGKKRTWEGSQGLESKRRGMKMFSLKSRS